MRFYVNFSLIIKGKKYGRLKYIKIKNLIEEDFKRGRKGL